MKYPLVAARTVAATPPRGLHHLRCCVSERFSLYRQGPLSPIILGMDWIKQNRCRICTDTGMVYLDDPSFYDNELVVDCAQVPTFFTHSKLDPALRSHDYILVCSTDTTTILPHAEAEIIAYAQWGPVAPTQDVFVHVGDTSYADKLRVALSPLDRSDGDSRRELPLSSWRAFQVWQGINHNERRWRWCGMSKLQDRQSEGYIIKAPTGGGVRSESKDCPGIVQVFTGQQMNSNMIRLRVYNDGSATMTIPTMCRPCTTTRRQRGVGASRTSQGGV